jgi:bifunctional UDP-N-acetylglucosamine pyrophosphorylase/glucosamine-1-phosphate N-acetyltransferase
MGRLAVLILAAGKGTRMKSDRAKVLHPVGGLPMLEYVVRAARSVSHEVSVVVGYQAERVMASVGDVGFVRQARQLGTGHAVIAARRAIEGASEVLILPGDVPLVSAGVLGAFVDFYRGGEFAGAVLTATLEDPSGYGRIIRRSRHEIDRIVEDCDANAEIRQIREVNSAICAFDVARLLEALDKLGTENTQGEYYLTDVVGLLSEEGSRIGAFEAPDPTETLGINSRRELAAADRLLRRRKCDSLMNEGVSIMDPESAWIDTDVRIGPDSIIYPFVTIEGASVLASETTVRSFTRLTDTNVGRRSTILENCVIEQSEIHDNVQIGPSARMRPGCVLEDGVKIGNFVELKRSRLGKGTRAGHLSYLGDTETGRNVNVGAGTITCNYDGLRKHPTLIGDNVFIGSDSQLIAPVRIGKGAYVAAGSTITEDVPAHALAIGRARQTVKKGWAKKRAEKAGTKGRKD